MESSPQVAVLPIRTNFPVVRRGAWMALLLSVPLVSAGALAQDDAVFLAVEQPAVNPSVPDTRSALRSTASIPTWGGETMRHRRARIDFAQLEEVRTAVAGGKPASISLNLFDDVVFKVVDLRTSRTATGYSLSGSVEGVRWGTASLVVNGEAVAGSVRTPLATYTIDSSGEGVCHLRQVDASTLPNGAEPLRAEPPTNPFGANPGAAAAGVSGSADAPTVTDVLVLFTPAVRDARGGIFPVHAMVDLWVTETNQAYEDSGVDQRIFLTRTVEVDYAEGGNSDIDLTRLADPSDGYLDIAHELREQAGADLVHLVALSDTVCGIAYLMVRVDPAFEALGFGLTDHTCGGAVFAHELGHNMGLRHDRYVDPGNSPYPYSHGYVNQAAFEPDADLGTRWRTIMAYSNQCRDAGFSCGRLLRFSNPDQTYEDDTLGVAGETETLRTRGPADAVRSLNNARAVVAGYREAGPDLAIAPVILDRSWETGQSVFLLAAVVNQGRIESAETTATYYRSTDPIIGTDDTELGSFQVAVLQGKESASNAFATTAPTEAGRYYYGTCVGVVDGETDTGNNCSRGFAVSVGPTVSVTDASTGEGLAVTFSVTLSETRSTAVEVRWELTRGTAVAGLDYADAGGTVTIAPNATLGTISVDTFADTLAEADDTFILTLVETSPAPPAGVVLSADAYQASGTIVDDDGDPAISDENLHVALTRALGKRAEDDITAAEMAGLKSLVASSAEIESIAGLEAATGLQTLTLDGNAVTDLAPLGHLAGLERLHIASNGITDVSALAALDGVTELRLSGNKLTDLSPLASLTALTELSLDENRLTDLSPLAALTELETLDLGEVSDAAPAAKRNAVNDLVPLAGLSRLSTLVLNFNEVADLSPLRGLTQLSYLSLWGNEISDVSPLRNLKRLIWLDLDENAVVDIAPLAGLSELTYLWLFDNEVAELPNLEEMDSLRVLTLDHNRLTDIGPLAALEGMVLLRLDGNAITNIDSLAGLTSLQRLYLGDNRISDVSPLANLARLTRLWANGNLIRDVRALANLSRLVNLNLSDNAIRNVAPLANLTSLSRLDLANNQITDIEPLVENAGLRVFDRVYLQGNPLAGASFDGHVGALRARGVTVYNIGVWIVAASAVEGSSLEFTLRLSEAVEADVDVEWSTTPESATPGDDYPMGQGGKVTIPAGDTSATFMVAANEDDVREPHETFRVGLAALNFPLGVAIAEGEGLGLIVDPDGPSADVPVFAPATHETRQGFLRVINRGERTVVHIDAVDDAGNRQTSSLAIDAGETLHFNSGDLENGNFDKGLSRGVGSGTGDWRLKLLGNAVEVLAYMRTGDGFLTSLHDLVPAGADGYAVPTFNLGKNVNQVSWLRLINAGVEDATVTVAGVDDDGAASEGSVELGLAAGQARTISSKELETGDGLEGALGEGVGKWRLLVVSDQPIGVASLLESPTGHLTNLSTLSENKVPGDDGTTHRTLLFPSASDATGRQGFVRVINREGEAGTVGIKAYDDSSKDYPAITLEMGAGETEHFNSDDLEMGNDAKGLPVGVGMGEGNWRLAFTSALDLDVLAYIRTEDGFLTSMHDTVPGVDGVHRVPVFNPASNPNQVSLLRLINAGEQAAAVAIKGFDDAGVSHGEVRLSVPGGSVRTLSAQQLESGDDDFTGALGDGGGKWWLTVATDHPIDVMSLLQSPTGHLTNLSTTPGVLATADSFAAEASGDQ